MVDAASSISPTPDASPLVAETAPGRAHHYWVHIDGLRALAVLSVVLFHLGFGFPGGYVGVDVFFVISGFLITGLIIRDLENGKFKLVDFWERRIRRIMPALALVVIASLVAGWFIFYVPAEFKDLAESALAQSLLSSNYYFWTKSGYFEDPFAPKALLHTWSLSVEEQFYLFFPLLLMGIYKFAKKALIPIIVLCLAVSLAVCIYLSYNHERSNFFFLPPRAWELLIGSLLAVLPAKIKPSRVIAEIASLLGLVGIFFAVFLYSGLTKFPGVAALPPCLGAALVIWANQNHLTTTGRILALPPLVFIGAISYSLYLWHWPILIYERFLDHDLTMPSHRFIVLIASFVAAVLSWWLVETPIRKRLILKDRRQIFTFAAVVTTLICAASLTIIAMKGMPERFPPAALLYADNPPPTYVHTTLKLLQDENVTELGVGDKTQPIAFLLCGDSHAGVLIPILNLICNENHIRGVAIVHSLTNPLIGFENTSKASLKKDSIPFQKGIFDYVQKHHIKNVFFGAVWGSYRSGANGTEKNLIESYRNTVEAYKGTGVKLWFIQDVPGCPFDPPHRLTLAVIHGENPDSIYSMTAEEHRQKVGKLFDLIRGDLPLDSMTVIDPTDCLIDQTQQCRVSRNGRSLYNDQNHLSFWGSMELRPLFEPLIKSFQPEATTRP